MGHCMSHLPVSREEQSEPDQLTQSLNALTRPQVCSHPSLRVRTSQANNVTRIPQVENIIAAALVPLVGQTHSLTSC